MQVLYTVQAHTLFIRRFESFRSRYPTPTVLMDRLSNSNKQVHKNNKEEDLDTLFFSGCNNGKIIAWQYREPKNHSIAQDQQTPLLKQLYSVDLDAGVQSMCKYGDKLLIGTRKAQVKILHANNGQVKTSNNFTERLGWFNTIVCGDRFAMYGGGAPELAGTFIGN